MINSLKPSKTMQIERVLQELEDKANLIREEVRCISDENLCLFADWLANNELQTVSRFIEAKAYDESLEDDSF